MITDRYTQELQRLGQRLRHLRKTKKLTQADVEVLTGIDPSDISRIENGQKNIEFITIVKFAEALEVELREFFTT